MVKFDLGVDWLSICGRLVWVIYYNRKELRATSWQLVGQPVGPSKPPSVLGQWSSLVGQFRLSPLLVLLLVSLSVWLLCLNDLFIVSTFRVVTKTTKKTKKILPSWGSFAPLELPCLNGEAHVPPPLRRGLLRRGFGGRSPSKGSRLVASCRLPVLSWNDNRPVAGCDWRKSLVHNSI